jgi:hypothetical protein
MNRELPLNSKSEADAYDAALDHLVDTRGISYDDARRELGKPPYELYDATKSVAVARSALKVSSMQRRRRSGHGPQRGEEEGVGYPGGKPHYMQPYAPLMEEQAARNTGWIHMIRHNLSQSHDGNDLKK